MTSDELRDLGPVLSDSCDGEFQGNTPSDGKIDGEEQRKKGTGAEEEIGHRQDIVAGKGR